MMPRSSDGRRSFPGGILFTLLAALAMAGGVAFFKLRGGPAVEPAIAVRLEQPAMDLGVAVPRSEVTGSFVLENAGSQTVTVEKVATDCGCFVPGDIVGARVLPGRAQTIPFRFRARVQGAFERSLVIAVASGTARAMARGTVRGVSLPASGWFLESGDAPELGIVLPGETRTVTSRLVGRPDVLQRLAFRADSPQITITKGERAEPEGLAGLQRLAVGIQVTGVSGGSPGGTVLVEEEGKVVGRIAVRWDSVVSDRYVRTRRFLGVIASGSEQEIMLPGARPDSRTVRGVGVEIVPMARPDPSVVVVRFPKDKTGLHKAEIEVSGGDAPTQIIELTASLSGAGSGV